MSAYGEAEEVAKDFQDALEDLSSNARFEIQNLTVIARENMEYADTISRVLQDHINKVGSIPLWKQVRFSCLVAHTLTLL